MLKHSIRATKNIKNVWFYHEVNDNWQFVYM